MIKIVADTLSCIKPEEARELGIGLLPQIIIFESESYRDDNEITTEEFLIKLKASVKLPKTAAPSPALYDPIYKEFAEGGNTIIVICPSKEVSGTYRSASVAAQDFPDADIRVIDTLSIGPALGTLVRLAVQWAKDGMDADAIIERIMEKANSVRIYFYVETLEYLHKGGRIGNASALIGGLLQVKPILQFADGKIQPFESRRTKQKALNRLIEIVENECPPCNISHLSLMETDANQTAQDLKEEFMGRFNCPDIPIYDTPVAIAVHVGPGLVASTFFVE